MHIFIDESGSFVPAAVRGRWSVVGAHVVPESGRLKSEQALWNLKSKLGVLRTDEVKLPSIDESLLLQFVEALAPARSLLFCVAFDAGADTAEQITSHRGIQVQKIRVNIPRMRFEGGKNLMERLASQLEAVSNQLYVQLICQVMLVHFVLSNATTYYAKRVPGTLSNLRWRIDRKNTTITRYEQAFLDIAPGLLQTMSIEEPFMQVADRDYNYSKLQAFSFPEGQHPNYLHTQYGLPAKTGYDILKMFTRDLAFVDSARSPGVQIADILTSATSRCLRGSFDSPRKVASSLGSLMLSQRGLEPPVMLVRFGGRSSVDEMTAVVTTEMRKTARSML